ncbi:MAG TPA: cbb3-type cytochrome c oxidase subunit I [Candidatus Kapabacteria bacterium]|nr:cbb3-type cytochrome c oxidase subunit I [Candidatus Kapabacteria bacterium]HPU23950.1 cbb3-type cytochrome c oxidase subunit I [Candidatus Kapabacteria bacterium]
MSNSNSIPIKSFYEYEGKHKGILGWILSTDHKRIGLLYLWSMVGFFLVGVFLGFLMRLEMLSMGPTIMGPQTYNAIFTLHGIIMIFLFIVPGIPAAFGNFLLPIMIGAEDVQFPRLNLLSWWLYVTGGLFAIVSLFLSGGPIDTGWTFYVPYSIRTSTQVILPLLAAFILGFSSILTGINFITTVHRMRAKGMTFFKLPLFVWALYATGWIQIIGTPVIGITILLVIIERVFSVGLFDPALGGDPILFQHLFWIYSHPAVYIMILPAMGVVSEIIPTFARKHIFGYKAIAFSSLAIAFIGTLVWGHHMFTSGMSDTARWVYSFLTYIVALPSAVKVFNWVATMYKGSIRMSAPFAFVMAFIVLFSIGGLTGLILGSVATNVHVHDTYFVVAHFHFVMFGGTGFIFFAAMHYWFPKMFGKMYNEKIAMTAVGILTVGFLMLYFTMFILGYEGMPRRYYDYLPQFQFLHIFATVGSWVLISGLLLMFGNLLYSLKKGAPAKANPWNGMTLEWMTSSPPPFENFNYHPEIKYGPYEYEHYDEAVKDEYK